LASALNLTPDEEDTLNAPFVKNPRINGIDPIT